MGKSCIHIYCGDGKGKSTAVMGLCAPGGRKREKGSSHPVSEKWKILGAEYSAGAVPGDRPHLPEAVRFFLEMTEEQKQEAGKAYQELFNKAVRTAVEEDAFLLVMDEFIAAYNHGMVNQERRWLFKGKAGGPGGGADRKGSGPGASGAGGLCVGNPEGEASL